MRISAVAAALFAAAVVACVPTTELVSKKVGFDKTAHPDLKSVALLSIAEPRHIHMCEYSFTGLNRCEELEANEVDAHYGAQLSAMIAAKLQRIGYRVERIARPTLKKGVSQIDYAKLETRASAILDVNLNAPYFGFVLGKDSAYRPSVLVTTKLMKRGVGTPVYTQAFDCQQIAGGDQSIVCPAKPEWTFPPVDHMTVRDSTEPRVQQTITGVFEFISDRIASDLSK